MSGIFAIVDYAVFPNELAGLRVQRVDKIVGAGIDVARLDGDLVTNAKAIDAILARNNDQATAFGFAGTPSFIIGKFRVPGVLTMAQFDQAIADARKAAAKK